MKSMTFALIASQLFATAAMAANTNQHWSLVDSVVARCQAQLMLSYNAQTAVTMLTVNNHACKMVQIRTMNTQIKQALTADQQTNIDVSSISGQIIPIQVDGNFMQLSTAGIAPIANQYAQGTHNRHVNEAAAAGAGVAVVAGAAAVTAAAAQQGER